MEEFENDQNDPEWKRLGSSRNVLRTSSSRRVRRPKNFDDYVTPFLKREPVRVVVVLVSFEHDEPQISNIPALSLQHD